MEIVPLTLWREARGEGEEGMTAVAHVIRNRANPKLKQWSNDPEEVCLDPYQFSSWNTNDPERKLYPKPGDEAYTQAVEIWENLGDVDPTHGATFYRNEQIAGPYPAGYEITAVIGHHTFAVEKKK